MFAGGMVLAATVLFFAAWLQWTEHQGWPYDSFNMEEDGEYLTRRRRSRLIVNGLLALCGLLICTATLAGVGVVFAVAWTLVTLNLMIIVLLAGLDAFRTHRYHKDRLRALRERAFDE
jgi:pheromone shutdown protein TraB